MGLTGLLSTRISKWQWEPLAMPVAPMAAMTWSPLDALADIDVNRVAVRVIGEVAVVVLDDDEPAVSAVVPPGFDDEPAVGRDDVCAAPVGDVDALVVRRPEARSAPEIGRDSALRRPDIRARRRRGRALGRPDGDKAVNRLA